MTTIRYGTTHEDGAQVVHVDGVPTGLIEPHRLGWWKASTMRFGRDAGLKFPTRLRAARWVAKAAARV